MAGQSHQEGSQLSYPSKEKSNQDLGEGRRLGADSWGGKAEGLLPSFLLRVNLCALSDLGFGGNSRRMFSLSNIEKAIFSSSQEGRNKSIPLSNHKKPS